MEKKEMNVNEELSDDMLEDVNGGIAVIPSATVRSLNLKRSTRAEKEEQEKQKASAAKAMTLEYRPGQYVDKAEPIPSPSITDAKNYMI